MPQEYLVFPFDFVDHLGIGLPKGFLPEGDPPHHVRGFLDYFHQIEAPLSQRQQVQPALFKALHLGYAGRCPHTEGFGAAAHFRPFPDQHDAERSLPLNAIANHVFISFLKNVKRKAHTGEENQIQRKQG